MKKISIFVLVVLFVASATVVMARPYMGAGKGMERDGRASAFQKMNLTEEQTAKIDVLRESLQKETTPLRTELLKKSTEMKLLWMADDPDADKIKALQKEILDLRGKMSEKFTDYRLAVHKILTPEQRTQLLARRSGKRGISRRNMGGHQDRGMGAAPRW